MECLSETGGSFLASETGGAFLAEETLVDDDASFPIDDVVFPKGEQDSIVEDDAVSP